MPIGLHYNFNVISNTNTMKMFTEKALNMQ